MLKNIADVGKVKEEIYECIKSARSNPKNRAHELVELLEDKCILEKNFGSLEISKDSKPKQNKYNEFCKAYIVHLFRTFVFDEDDVEIMLVAFNYHPAFKHEARMAHRRAQFAREVYQPKHREKKWGDSIEDKARGLRDEEARIMNELSANLAELACKQHGKLNLVEDVLTMLNSPEAEGGSVDVADDENVVKRQ